MQAWVSLLWQSVLLHWCCMCIIGSGVGDGQLVCLFWGGAMSSLHETLTSLLKTDSRTKLLIHSSWFWSWFPSHAFAFYPLSLLPLAMKTCNCRGRHTPLYQHYINLWLNLLRSSAVAGGGFHQYLARSPIKIFKYSTNYLKFGTTHQLRIWICRVLWQPLQRWSSCSEVRSGLALWKCLKFWIASISAAADWIKKERTFHIYTFQGMDLLSLKGGCGNRFKCCREGRVSTWAAR